jgi:DNA-binding NtrC family response regulator
MSTSTRPSTNNKFRRDLAARLRASNAPLELAPLRDRREDIPQWSRRFLQEAGRPDGDDAWTVGALECMMLFPWLENLRELRAVIRALVAEPAAFHVRPSACRRASTRTVAPPGTPWSHQTQRRRGETLPGPRSRMRFAGPTAACARPHSSSASIVASSIDSCERFDIALENLRGETPPPEEE